MVGLYKRSKYLAEQAVLALVRDRAVPVIIVNPTAPIGPRDIKPTPTGKMIADAAAGRMPAYVDTGSTSPMSTTWRRAMSWRWNAAGRRMLHPWRRGPVHAGDPGDGGAGIWPTGAAHPAAARRPLPGGIGLRGPGAVRHRAVVTRDVLAMARKKMFFSSAKARSELGYVPRPAIEAITDAIAWFRAAGRVPA